MNIFINFINRVIAVILLILSILPFIIIAFGIKISSNGPIIHWSKRIGKDNEIFLMPKFRTLEINTPDVATHILINHDKYSFFFGSILRKSSIDELPQLWSVVRGDMNFVGPRPALHNQIDLKKLRTEKNIQILKPGITGWAQVNGRDEISLSEKVNYDFDYLKKRSLLFDLYIIFLTVISVVKKKDINH